MSFEQFCGITQSVTIIVLRAGELCSRVVHHFSCLKLQSFSGAYRFSRSPPAAFGQFGSIVHFVARDVSPLLIS